MTARARKRERLWRAIAARSLPAPSDLELLERWRAGDREAGEELRRRHGARLHGFFATKCGGDAGELVQRTLLASLRPEVGGAGADAATASSFRAYLFALAWRELRRDLEQRRGAVDLSTASIADLLGPRRQDGGA